MFENETSHVPVAGLFYQVEHFEDIIMVELQISTSEIVDIRPRLVAYKVNGIKPVMGFFVYLIF